MSKTTDFGFEKVTPDEKTKRVHGVFRSVAEKYDVMNDVMSFGLHRLWKKVALQKLNLRGTMQVLDLAGGTGDLAIDIAKKLSSDSHIILADINESMLNVGRKRILDLGLMKKISCLQVNAETLPFTDNYFDRIIIGFGLRNVTDKMVALASMYRVTKPGGYCMVLEFSKPKTKIMNKLYDVYSFSILPKMGQWIANDSDSYRYLAESIRMHPAQEELKRMILEAGFDECRYYNLTDGIVAIHIGYKY